jgi:hypothetical protein
MINEKYPYLYETHLHTSQGSRCARNTGHEMAEAAKKAGYSGIIVTDHSWYGNCNVDNALPWSDWVSEFCKGYEDAKSWGDKNDLSVFFGYESCYKGTEFLVYGVDGQWLAAHPEIKDATIPEQHALINSAGGMVIHAHPYREEWYIPEIRLFPEDVDGVEGVNATHSSPLSTAHKDPNFNTRAISYAKEHNLPMTAGSDVHTTLMFGGGVAFDHKLNSISDYITAIRTNSDRLLTDGAKWYDKNGNSIE